jgi:D-aminopeptidase
VLAQTNQGDRKLLQINGAPVGQKLNLQHTPAPWDEPKYSSSIIAIVATDAPLIPAQCKALAQRATIGLARTGGIGHTGSGDIFLAFSTANTINADAEVLLNVTTIPHHGLNSLFEATIEAVEEAIINSLTAAETMIGFKNRTAYALPLDDLQRVMANY